MLGGIKSQEQKSGTCYFHTWSRVIYKLLKKYEIVVDMPENHKQVLDLFEDYEDINKLQKEYNADYIFIDTNVAENNVVEENKNFIFKGSNDAVFKYMDELFAVYTEIYNNIKDIEFNETNKNIFKENFDKLKQFILTENNQINSNYHQCIIFYYAYNNLDDMDELYNIENDGINLDQKYEIFANTYNLLKQNDGNKILLAKRMIMFSLDLNAYFFKEIKNKYIEDNNLKKIFDEQLYSYYYIYYHLIYVYFLFFLKYAQTNKSYSNLIKYYSIFDLQNFFSICYNLLNQIENNCKLLNANKIEEILNYREDEYDENISIDRIDEINNTMQINNKTQSVFNLVYFKFLQEYCNQLTSDDELLSLLIIMQNDELNLINNSKQKLDIDDLTNFKFNSYLTGKNALFKVVYNYYDELAIRIQKKNEKLIFLNYNYFNFENLELVNSILDKKLYLYCAFHIGDIHHAVTLVQFDPKERNYIFKNSWGTYFLNQTNANYDIFKENSKYGKFFLKEEKFREMTKNKQIEIRGFNIESTVIKGGQKTKKNRLYSVRQRKRRCIKTKLVRIRGKKTVRRCHKYKTIR